ncbi:hypothetical protein O6H91_14G068200 [Diphasiastrum complanatum]|uniref:Uncharacterized protein n=3 Tax=Diphasiastrum complanatum TaxID=34168 RepID=A0ACC2BQC0_DIPCM|nr:hypothetical protein O6H91_14G068200 [Diphasiastrum complanatum]KAJ7532005.1 hypothetical protein O6H91_14G068200 [Diphasiastrum complanatum]
MTIDDGNSIYVGGLSYESNEDMLRRAFEEYGDIVTVKIVNDRDSGQSRGFGFVTFDNARAAADAINKMDGRTIDGRMIRVDEVKNRLSKAMGREGNIRWRGRDVRLSKGRDRLGRGRHFSPLRRRRSSPNNFRSVRGRSPPRRRSRSPRKGRSRTPSRERRRTHSQSSPSNGSSERLQRNERNGETSAEPAKGGGRSSKDSKEKTFHYTKIKEDLDKAIVKREELQEQISNLENENDNDKQTILDLQNEGQKLQELLENAVTAASNRRSQLRKLQKAVLEVRECKRKLKASEKELEVALVETASEDLEAAGGEAREDRYEFHENGDARFEERQGNDEIQSPKF